ncbi:MAG: NAD-dependent epimerase/dehydratase family protein [Phycisphaerales bacterium]
MTTHQPSRRDPSRRQFIATTLLAGGTFALGGLAAARLAGAQSEPATGGANAGGPRLLILGGTGFIGPHMVEAALAKGWKVTIFNRGIREKRLEEMGRGHKWIDQVEVLYGNRDPDKRADDKDENSAKGLESLKGKSFDLVIDNSCFFPRHAKASAEMLAAAGAKHYLFISTISVYAENNKTNEDETAKLGTMSDPASEQLSNESYGPLKALAEQEVEKAFPGKAALVRPGFIVGPGDTTDRFTYWPWRAAQPGLEGQANEMLLPEPADAPIQFIDARDLADFCLLALEKKLTGAYNATGPATTLKSGDFFQACIDASPKKPTPVRVPLTFLQAFAETNGPVDLTIWIPAEGETAGFHTRNVSKAVNAGLKFRPLATTINDTMAWMKTRPEERQKKLAVGMTLEREAEVLKAFRENQARKTGEKSGG